MCFPWLTSFQLNFSVVVPRKIRIFFRFAHSRNPGERIHQDDMVTNLVGTRDPNSVLLPNRFAQYLDHVFRMDWVGGEPFPADDESLQARWFDLADTPDMSDDMRRRIELAGGGSLDSPSVFETGLS